MKSQTVKATIGIETDVGEVLLEVEGYYTPAERESRRGPGAPESLEDVQPVDPKLTFSDAEERERAVDALWDVVRARQEREADPDVERWESARC